MMHFWPYIFLLQTVSNLPIPHQEFAVLVCIVFGKLSETKGNWTFQAAQRPYRARLALLRVGRDVQRGILAT
jgi:hypothetical protein